MPFTNRVFRDLFGDPGSKTCFEHLFGRTEPCETCQPYEVLKTSKPQQWQWTVPNGRTYDIHDFPFTDTDGSPLILEMGMDITDRKRAEDEVRFAYAYNRSLIEASVDPLVTINPQGLISDVNTATERVTGYAREKLIGTDFCEYFTNPAKAKAGYEQAFREGTVHDYELEILHKDGHATPVLYNASIYRDESGKVVGIFAAARDISKRKMAETALRKSEETARAQHIEIETYYNMTPIGLCILDTDLRYVKVNQALAKINDLPASAHLGRTIREVVPIVADQVEQTARHVLETGESVSDIEFTVDTPTGRRTVRATLFPFKDTYEHVTRIGVMVEDITQQRQLEDQLRQSQKLEAIGTLAGGIAHDFNNILAAIIGFAEMVEEDLPSESPSIPRIGRVLSAANRGKELVRQILAFSRKAEPAREPLSLSPVIDETIQLLRASLPSTIDIKLSMKAARDTILASPTEIQQILMNLATNAFFAMREKGGTLGIRVTDIEFEPDSPVLDADVEAGEYVQLTVTDTGIGMTQDVMKRAFDPFFTTKEVGKGTGMGLAVVYGIVKSLGGTVAIESEPGIGSTFRIFLPVARTDVKSEEGREQVIPKGTEHILFIDDEDLIVEWGQAALERLGYSVTALTDSAGALNLFSSDPSAFDLIILDQTMPKLTGLHLARKLLEIRANIPIILCTGHSDSVSPQKAREAGIRDFLMKPLGKQQLAEAIRRVLNTTESEH
jgi:PAS domain S-box-containing protein